VTLSEFAYYGEVVAAISVVASLVYVARRVGQNTAMMRISAASERLQREFDIASPVLQSRETAEIWVKSENEFDSLDEVDQQRMIVYERRAIALWHHIYVLRNQKLYADAEWHEALWMIQKFGRRQANRAAWRACKGAFETRFQDFVDQQIEIADRAVLQVYKK
jgi:hypothetical protein